MGWTTWSERSFTGRPFLPIQKAIPSRPLNAHNDHHTGATEGVLLQELLWDLGAPDGEALVAGGAVAHGGVLVDEVAVGVVLDHEAVDVPPVVEDLAAEDVAADAPDGLVLFLGEPLVAQRLRVEVVHLERAVVHVLLNPRRQRRQEHRVVVHQILAPVDVCEQRHFFAHRCVRLRVDLVQRHVQDVARYDVEVPCVPFHGCREVGDVETKVAELKEEEISHRTSRRHWSAGLVLIPCEPPPGQARSAGNSSLSVYPPRNSPPMARGPSFVP